VVVYHAIAIWVPSVGGLIAWLPTRARRAAATAETTPRASKGALGWVAPAISEEAR
jgi:hypothetical protein